MSHHTASPDRPRWLRPSAIATTEIRHARAPKQVAPAITERWRSQLSGACCSVSSGYARWLNPCPWGVGSIHQNVTTTIIIAISRANNISGVRFIDVYVPVGELSEWLVLKREEICREISVCVLIMRLRSAVPNRRRCRIVESIRRVVEPSTVPGLAVFMASPRGRRKSGTCPIQPLAPRTGHSRPHWRCR